MIYKSLRTDIRIFVITVIALVVIGLIFVYSASSVFAMETFGNTFYFVKKQLIGLAIGIVGIIAIQAISRTTIQFISPFFFLIAVALTGLTLLAPFACRVNGSSRWLHLWHITFQPSELLKIALILFLSACSTQKTKKFSFFYGYAPIIAILIIPAFLLLKQPDFGLTITLFTTTLILLFVAQFELKHIVLTLISCIPVGILLVIMKPYRLQRMLTFFNPWHDPQGSGFQIIQSLIAIGSGGILGVGMAQSKQKFFYLPMQHTDFIFSIIAEETGFLGVSFLIALYLSLLYFGIKIAQQIQHTFSQLVIIGFVTVINLQAIINIAVASNLLPTKGSGLPFISYGNTALVCNLWMIGIILLLAREQND